MSNVNVVVSLLVDFAHESLPRYQTLSATRQKQLRTWFWNHVCGTKQAAVIELCKREPGPWHPEGVEPSPGTDLPSHPTIHTIAADALTALNDLRLPYTFAIVEDPVGGGEHDGMDMDEGMAADPADPLPPYHCIRWVLIDGEYVLVYNYAIAVTPEGQSTPSTEILISDTIGTADQMTGRIHLVVECRVPVPIA